ncbi:hypothetical protein OROGR_014556 [Orobanche gracilis]
MITGLHFGNSTFHPQDDHLLRSDGIFHRILYGKNLKVGVLRKRFNARDFGRDIRDYAKHVAMKEGQEHKEYHFYGPIWALQIWSYEMIPALGELCGIRDKSVQVPLCLMWTTRKIFCDFTHFFDDKGKKTLLHTPAQQSQLASSSDFQSQAHHSPNFRFTMFSYMNTWIKNGQIGVSPFILNCLSDVNRIKEWNWSEYVMRSLVENKTTYAEENASHFVGPLLFLMGGKDDGARNVIVNVGINTHVVDAAENVVANENIDVRDAGDATAGFMITGAENTTKVRFTMFSYMNTWIKNGQIGVSPFILNCLSDVNRIKEWNWSEYVMRSLVENKTTYAEENASHFVGPLLFLMGGKDDGARNVIVNVGINTHVVDAAKNVVANENIDVRDAGDATAGFMITGAENTTKVT